MKRLLSLTLVLAVMLAAMCVAPASAEPDKGNWLHIFYNEDFETLDVQMTTNHYMVPINCFDRLVECETDDNGVAQLVPGLETDGAHVKVNRKMETNLPGLFACGDITGTPYQYVKAAGEGNVAAISAAAYIEKTV